MNRMHEGNQENDKVSMLEKEGWTRQFVASEPRLSEAVQIYMEAGLEVYLLPLPEGEEPDDTREARDGECRKCFQGFEDQYKIIFTRPQKGRAGREGDPS